MGWRQRGGAGPDRHRSWTSDRARRGGSNAVETTRIRRRMSERCSIFRKTAGSPPGVLGQLLGPGIQYGAGRGKGSDRPQTWPSDRTRPGGSSNVEMVEIDLAVAELHAKERKTAGSPPGVLGQGVGCSPGPYSSPIDTKLTGCTERHAFCRTSKFDVDRRSSQGCWVTAARSDPTAENCWVRVLGALPSSIRAQSPRNL